jgi:hypothetical protein
MAQPSKLIENSGAGFGWDIVAEIYEDCSIQEGDFLASLAIVHFSVKTLYSDVRID